MKKRVSLINPLERSLILDLHSDMTLQPRYGAVSVATRIRDAGYETRFFCEMSGSTIDWDYVASSDYICLSLMSFSSHRGYELISRIRRLTHVPIICGGNHATVLPDECLEYCDYVVRNEGEATVLELLSALDNDKDVSGIDGISYRCDGAVVHRPNREFIQHLDWSVDYSVIDGYRPRKFACTTDLLYSGKPWFHFPVSQASRGCPRNCSFCFGRRELGNRYRRRKIGAVRSEVEGVAKLLYGSRAGSKGGAKPCILFVDNDFCVDKEFTLRCLEALGEVTSEYDLEYYIFTRIETAQDAAFMRKMRALGVGVVFLGIESINDSTLRLYAKGQSRQDIVEAVTVCRNIGMEVLGFFVLGADTDTADVVSRSVEFAMQNELHNVGLFSLYDFPYQTERMGFPQMIPNHRFIHHDWRFFNSNFVLHFPMNMKPSRLQQGIVDGYRQFDQYRCSSASHIDNLPYVERRILRTMEDYCEYLRSVEDDFYNREGRLIEAKLVERSPEGIRRLVI